MLTLAERVPPRLYAFRNLTRDAMVAATAELAGHPAARRRGLLGRTGLAPGEGLWIVPCEAIHTFRMAFPIDVVFLDSHHCVKKIRAALPPNRISFCVSAHSVLELPAGQAAASQLAVGHKLAITAV